MSTVLVGGILLSLFGVFWWTMLCLFLFDQVVSAFLWAIIPVVATALTLWQ